jgi:hypothetical protein
MAHPIATPDCELDNSRADFLNFLKSIILVFDMTRVHLIQGTTANLIAKRENSHTEPDERPMQWSSIAAVLRAE